MQSFDDLFIFAKVIDIGSFHHAGKVLKMNETTISRRIKALEHSLGTKLLIINTSGFKVTDTGKQIYELIKVQTENIDNILVDITSIVKGNLEPHGTLNVLLPPVLAFDLISPYIPNFSRKYPKINLNICYQNIHINWINDGFDVVVLNHIPAQQSQKIKIIYNSHSKLYCSKSYKEKYGIPLTINDLKNHLFVGYMLDDFSIPENTLITEIKTGNTISIPTPRKIISSSAAQAMRMLKSNEVICGAWDYTSISESECDVIAVLPEYFVASVTYYLLKNPSSNILNVEIFSRFLEECLTEANASVTELDVPLNLVHNHG